ncbi:MAG: FecR family protein [Candidatus Riflebacteria bacterium]|nr:FecR family protein [Candidatus Riflebacteria bacterium]
MKNYFTFALSVVAIAFAAGITLPCLAVDLSATEITSINGHVEVKKTVDALFKKLNNNLKLAGAQKRLDGGDKVRTYEQSAAEMALKDTCILAVKEQSIFEVPQTLGQAAIKELTAQQGTILFKVVTGSNFQVQTADVIAGVKGTLFSVDIVDNFVTLLETPALQIGIIAPGATNINVYEGEVELTHKETGKKRNLKAGEGIAALSSLLMGLDQSLSEGFTPLREVSVNSAISQIFGNNASGWLNAGSSLSNLTDMPTLNNIKSNLETNRLTDMFSAASAEIQKGVEIINASYRDLSSLEKFVDIGGSENSEYLGVAVDIGKAFSGPGYKADFSKNKPETREFMVADNRFKEVYLGNTAFAACKAGAGSKSAKISPNQEGILLSEGNAMFRVRRYKNTDISVEFLASHYMTDNQLVTTIKVIKGDLYGRIPGSLEHFKIPAGEMSFVYGANTGKGNWMQAATGAIDASLNDYTFNVADKIAKEKAQFDKNANQKKKEAGKKVLNKALEKVNLKRFW